MNEINPTGRTDAYYMMAHLAQSMANEVSYSEELRKVNAQLRQENENYKDNVTKLNIEINRLKNDKGDLLGKSISFQQKYYDLLKKYEPEEYKKVDQTSLIEEGDVEW